MEPTAQRCCLVLGLTLLGCATSRGGSTSPPPPRVVQAPGQVPAGVDQSAYVTATSSDELAELIRADLEQRRARQAYEGIEAFAFTAIEEGRSTNADLLLQGVRPLLLFQHHGGQAYLTPVKTIGGILRDAATRELEDVYSSLEQGDMQSIARARNTSRAVLHDDTVRLSSALLPHAHFFDGVLAYAELETQPAPGPDDARRVVASMEQAAGPFAKAELDEPLFLALVISAQALERAGEREPAIEKWLQAAESRFWPSAPQDLRVAIQGRIESYRSALRDQVEADVQGAWEARVAEIEASAKLAVDAANARVVSLEGDLGAARARQDELALALEEERAEAERERERAATREQIRELEGQLNEARRALDSVAAGGAAAADGVTVNNVLTLWQAWKGAGARARPST